MLLVELKNFIKFTSYVSCQEVDSDCIIIFVVTAEYVSCKCELAACNIGPGVSHSKKVDTH